MNELNEKMKELGEKDLCRILTEPKNALVKQYSELLKFDGLSLDFDEDALALIGVPTSTITTLYNTISDDFYGKITQTYNNSNHYRFDILFGVYSEIDFDVNSSFKGYPIVFQLAMSSPANYQGNSSYKVTTDVRYVTKQITNIGTVTSYYYTDSNNAEKNYTVTLQ